MKRGTRRARARQAGFSFVELLVTIIIAGIAFSAFVPAYLNAQSKNADDNIRNIAMQLARDKVEKIRQLPYEQVDAALLATASFADGQFGPTWTAYGGGGNAKTMRITYTVSGGPTGVEEAQQTFKAVTVSVGWDAPPGPVVPAVVTTIVYKQFAGPQIAQFDIGPDGILSEISGTDSYEITGSPAVIDAYIDSSDIGSMIPLVGSPSPTPDPDQDNWGYVRFTVSSITGTEVASQDVKEPVGGEPGHYQWTWDNSLAEDGIYLFTATAFSSSGQQGNEVSYAFQVRIITPAAITGLQGTAGNNYNSLIWTASPIGDFDHYTVYRSTDGVNFTELSSSVPVANYTDNTATNGTTYYYYVTVSDADGNTSPDSAVVGPLTPAVPTDAEAPSTPATFTVSQVASQNALTLAWAAAVDTGSPASGVKGYDVERSPDGSTWSQILSADAFNQLTYTDTGLGWSTQYYYRVRAVDVAGNQGEWTSDVSATTVAMVKWNLTIVNANTSAAISIWVQSATTGLYWVGGVNPSYSLSYQPSGKSIAKKKSVIWYALPADTYNVTSGGGQAQAVTLSANSTLTFSN